MEFPKRVMKPGRVRCGWLGLTAAAVLLLASPPARADVFWKVQSGDWSSVGNWIGGLPTSTTTANISNNGTATISTTGDACEVLLLANGGGGGSVQMTGGSLTVSSSALVGGSGTGSFTQSGGTNTISSNLYLGYNPGSSGNYILSGSGQLSTANEYVADSGTGNFTQSGGANSGTNLYLGYSAGGSGTYSLSGSGQLSAPTEYVGYSGTGVFTQFGGTNTVSGTLCLGCAPNSTGTYTLTGAGTLNADSGIYVGNGGLGQFEWLANTSTLSTPILALGSSSTLALGFDFDMGALTSGTLFNGSVIYGLSSATLEITNGATATQTGERHGGGWNLKPGNNRRQRDLQPQRFRPVVRRVL